MVRYPQSMARESWTRLNMFQVLYKRKPVTMIPAPAKIDNNAEVRTPALVYTHLPPHLILYRSGLCPNQAKSLQTMNRICLGMLPLKPAPSQLKTNTTVASSSTTEYVTLDPNRLLLITP